MYRFTLYQYFEYVTPLFSEMSETITEQEWCYFFMSWRLRFNICNDALDDLLKFLSLAHGSSDGPLSSYHKFEHYFKKIMPTEPMTSYVFCPDCRNPFAEKDVSSAAVCPCGRTLPDNLKKTGQTFLYSSL